MNIADFAFIIEFGLVFGAFFAFCFWQLHSLNKLDRQEAEQDASKENVAE